MPRAIALPVRQQIVQLRRDGVSMVQIARQLDEKYRTVRALWYRYCDLGEAGLEIHYDRCGPSGSSYPPNLVAAALAMKRAHARWGAGLVRVELARQFPGVALPHPRTLQRWWTAAGLQPLRSRDPKPDATRAKEVHDTWQVDAKERMTLADGSGACSLTATDEASGALLDTEVFPPVSLDASAHRSRASGDASVLRAAWEAAQDALRQRGPVALLQGSAHGVGPVAGGSGDHPDLQPALSPHREPQSGTV